MSTGTKLGPYQLTSLLGAGGMGEVYRARDPRLDRNVAIKVLPASLSSEAARLRRFEQEARAAAALNHPNILAVHDIGTLDSSPYIVSELLEGETLRRRLASGPLPARKAVDYAIQIAHGLAAAHDKGIIHRDLKPENIFLTGDGRVKILDFGLAKLTERGNAAGDATRTIQSGAGTVLGTVGYMAPEQVRGESADPRTDIFALGAVLYEMLSGQQAFRRDTAAETMTAVLREDPPELSDSGPPVAPGLELTVRRCLEKDPEQRYQSAKDLSFALAALSGSEAGGVVRSATKPRKMHFLLWVAIPLALVLMVIQAEAHGPLIRLPSRIALHLQLHTTDVFSRSIRSGCGVRL